uniref:Uncharacterized protein n=1 Tax=Wuchereria bancrofti TaxID=6293 RepID=A0A1I8EUW2_WUCBA
MLKYIVAFRRRSDSQQVAGFRFPVYEISQQNRFDDFVGDQSYDLGKVRFLLSHPRNDKYHSPSPSLFKKPTKMSNRLSVSHRTLSLKKSESCNDFEHSGLHPQLCRNNNNKLIEFEAFTSQYLRGFRGYKPNIDIFFGEED